MQVPLPDLPIATLVAEVPETVWAALVSALATLVLALLFQSRRDRGRADAAEVEGSCEFLVNGSSLKPLTGEARRMIESFAGRSAPMQALARHLMRDCPTIQSDLEGLILFGEGFRRYCPRADGTAYEVIGRPRGGAALITVRPASDEARALEETTRALAAARTELGELRETIDAAPVLAWRVAPDGQVTWANAAYRERFDTAAAGDRLPDAFGHALEELPLTARGDCAGRRRVKVPLPIGGDTQWFEVTEHGAEDGERAFFAVDADDLVAAEASLRRFVETLTETFAHLPIGLAVFDKNRRLGLFNPALSDLVKIDAVWLAGRPSLRDFLERLRETRQLPEQKDFAAFRRMLTELEEGARDGTYEENWQLPSGKIFRVSGRPHPQGALAFLFEDISAAITLERRYRSELELSQATLDRMAEAVAVFDTSGMLVFVNSAFEELWSLDPMQGLEGPGVAEMIALWQARCQPSPVWRDLGDFATGAETRTSWTAPLTTVSGRRLDLLVAPLPNGSTLVVFRMPGASLGAQDGAAPAAVQGLAAALAGEAAYGELRAPVDAALTCLAAAVGAAPNHASYGALVAAAQSLRDALARARAFEQAGAPDAHGATLASRLGGLLAAAGLRPGAMIEPAVAGGEADPDDDLIAALPALVRALAALAAPGAAAEAARAAGPVRGLALRAAAADAVDVTSSDAAADAATTDGAVNASAGWGAREPAAVTTARRQLAALGGRLELGREDDRVTVAARFPTSGRGPAPSSAATGGDGASRRIAMVR